MDFKQRLVRSATAELDLWTGNKWVECVRDRESKKPIGDPGEQQGSARVALYWRQGLGERDFNGCSSRAWSAAYICWAMREAGMHLDDFPFSAGHHTYIRWAINNTKRGKVGKAYYGRRATEYMPKPGDMIAQWRKEKGRPDPDIGFDVQPDDFYPAHCDIVVSTTPDAIRTVGGNVSNRVSETLFAARDGVLVAKKEIICVLECRKD